jgi:uncharacterized protein (DUF305 family)
MDLATETGKSCSAFDTGLHQRQSGFMKGASPQPFQSSSTGSTPPIQAPGPAGAASTLLGKTIITLRSVVSGEASMAKRHGRRWPWAAGLLSALLLSQGAGLSAAPAAPAKPPGQGLGAMGQRGVDQHFITMMMAHHDGAIAMAELALTRAKRPQIKALAQQIKTSQTAENAQMRRWYRQWYGTDTPPWPAGGMGMGMPGMATSLDALKRAPDFDRAFIEQMIPHHRMGVMMASHAEWNTQHPELRELEAAMVRVQSREIEQMAQWYRDWYGASSR